ncbi:SDR family oxidoreductase [Pedobacter frigiditerrae]|uniref:SDR family oxidoreductase n=1 Tax=Pedobacter frigiditerrae TaxID=2530452 RepID=A0A4V2MJG4_9SPHI|nr:SDR family oxidoreductase [Pedobacter frigiditerrae]TCC94156.1 SDR family oxidoreductase [Pedobacter frigiditerrae]
MYLSDQFTNKHFLITGASSGIGQQTAWDLGNTGAWLTLLGRDLGKLEETKKQIGTTNPLHVISGELQDPNFLDELTSSIEPIDGLVLSAGIIDYTPAKMINSQKIRKIFEINFDANVLLIQALLKKKKIKDGASIVVISSISSKLGVAGTGLYAASKAAITAYAKVLATELSGKKIRVNIIHPGIVKTNLIDDQGIVDQENMKKIELSYPLGFGSTGDVSNQILYLLSDLSTWVTGSEFIIDGGHTITR